MPRPTPSALKAYIRDDYDAAAPGWESYMGPYFRVPAERLVADLAPRRSDRCLDLACGSALVARAFARRVGPRRVAACDLSPIQAEEAESVLLAAGLPDIEVSVMDAERLAYPDASFERVGCGFGLNHFPRPLAALRGVRRVLAPGGRAGFTFWGSFSPDIRNRFDECLLEIVPAMEAWTSSPCEVAFGNLAHRNSRPARLVDLMGRAGFVRIEQRSHRFAADYVDAPTFVDAMLSRAERDLRRAGLGAEERADVRARLIDELAPYARRAFIVQRTYHTLLGSRPPEGPEPGPAAADQTG
jgi:ubiquinone/menaquinone biosynthesis C-methylase UbiE